MTPAVGTSIAIRRTSSYPPPLAEQNLLLNSNSSESAYGFPSVDSKQNSSIAQTLPPIDRQEAEIPALASAENKVLIKELLPLRVDIQNAFKQKNIQEVISLLSKINNLNGFDFDDILDQLDFKEDEKIKHIIEFLSEGLLGSVDTEFSFAIETLFHSTRTEAEHRLTTLTVIYLFKQFHKRKHFDFKILSQTTPIPQDNLLRQTREILASENKENLTDKKHAQQKQLDLFSSCIPFYYIYEEVPHNLKPIFYVNLDGSNNDDDSRKEKLVRIINLQEQILKNFNQTAKMVKSFDHKKQYNSPEAAALGVMNNFFTNAGPIANTLVNHNPGTPMSLSQDSESFAYNSCCFIASALFSALWRDQARNAKPAKLIQYYQKFLAKSLGRAAQIYGEIENNSDATQALQKRVEKYSEKINSPFYHKVKKGFRLFTCAIKKRASYLLPSLNKSSEKPIRYHAVPNTDNTRKMHLYSLHFNNIKNLKEAIFSLDKEKDFEAFTEMLSAYQSVENAELVKTPFKVTYNNQEYRLNLIQHLWNISLLSPDLPIETKEKIKDFLAVFISSQDTSIEELFSANKKIREETDWKSRPEAVSSIYEINLNILQNSNLPKSEKKFLIRCLIEKLEERENGQMAELVERRKKFSMELSVALGGYIPYSLRHVLPTLGHVGVPQNNFFKGLFIEAGWLLSSFIVPGFLLRSNTDTTTFKSILSSLKGSLEYLDDLEEDLGDESEQAANMHASLELNARKIQSLLDIKPLPTHFTQYVLNIFEDVKAKYGDAGVSFLLEHKMSFLLEHNGGKKKPLLFELLKVIPKSEKETFLKLYFPESDFLKVQVDLKDCGNDYDKFIHFFNKGIQKSKTSKNESALFAFKARGYLYHLLQAAEGDPEKIKSVKNCKNFLDKTLLNIGKSRHSDFKALTQRSEYTSFGSRSAVRAVGNLLWGFISFLTQSPAAGLLTATALSIGVNVALPGIGLGLSILIMAAFGVVRSISTTVSVAHPFMSHTNTNTFQFIKEHLDISDEIISKKLREQLAEKNVSLRNILKDATSKDDLHNNMTLELGKLLEELFEGNLDQKKIETLNNAPLEEKERIFSEMKEKILSQSIDKETVILFLLRVVYMISACDFSPEQKLKQLEILFQALQRGEGAFSKLHLEESFIRQKNWFIPNIALGSFFAALPASPLLTSEYLLQSMVSTGGDMVGGMANNAFNSPNGATKSVQESSLLIKNMVSSLLINHSEEEEVKAKSTELRQGILNKNTGRIRAWRGITTSAKIYDEAALNFAIPV